MIHNYFCFLQQAEESDHSVYHHISFMHLRTSQRNIQNEMTFNFLRYLIAAEVLERQMTALSLVAVMMVPQNAKALSLSVVSQENSILRLLTCLRNFRTTSENSRANPSDSLTIPLSVRKNGQF